VVAQDSGEKWGFPPLSTPRGIGPISGFCYRTVILGMRALIGVWRRGPTTQRIGVIPDQGVREGGVLDSVLDRSD
jgi:hypothetical protein